MCPFRWRYSRFSLKQQRILAHDPVNTQEGWLYLAGIKDVYTCEIVGYAMGERMTKELTGKALFMALRSQRPPAGLIHHSDRGSQYCAYDYRVIQEQ
ncbi:DDE-type integrase/transposase/recombinase, partial [Shigella sonnei]